MCQEHIMNWFKHILSHKLAKGSVTRPNSLELPFLYELVSLGSVQKLGSTKKYLYESAGLLVILDLNASHFHTKKHPTLFDKHSIKKRRRVYEV